MKPTLQDLGVQAKVLEQQALAKWREIVGPQIAASSRPDAIRDGVLFVTCKSSMWSSELSLHKQDITKRLNAAVGRKIITDIRFTARGFRKVAEPVAKIADPGVDSIKLGSEEAQHAEIAAALCESEELAARVRDAILTSERRKHLNAKEGETDG